MTVVLRPGGGASPGHGPLEKGDQPRFFAEPSLMTRLLLLLPRSPSRPVVPTLAPGAIHPDNMLACQPLPLLSLPGDAGRAGGSCLRSGRPHSTQNRQRSEEAGASRLEAALHFQTSTEPGS